MSVEDDTELRDLLTQTLEVNGCLAKIRAQLRASVFLALDDEEETNKRQPMLNNKIKTHLESIEGKVMFCIVREFLEFFNLDFTVSVFESESYSGYGYKYEGRCKLVQDLKIPAIEENSSHPVLLQLLRIAKATSGNKIDVNLTCIQNDNYETNLQNNDKSSTTPVTSEISSGISSRSSNLLKDEAKADKEVNLNETFDVSFSAPHNKHGESQSLSKETKNDENTSQKLAEAHENNNSSVTIDKSVKMSPSDSERSDQSVADADFSPPVLKDTKFPKFDASHEKLKKNEKLKPKNALCDFSPLQLNKSRGSDTMILPSLYSKEFKEKCGPKESDKFLDLDLDSMDNYEEDFMSSSDLDLSISRNEFDLKHPQSPKITGLYKNILINESAKSVRSLENSISGNDYKNNTADEKADDSSITSEDFEASSNAEVM